MAYSRADLLMAIRHVREGAQRIKKLRTSITVSRARGHPVVLPEQVLATMLVSQELMEQHLVEIEAALARSG